jgi:hypothetical protein
VLPILRNINPFNLLTPQQRKKNLLANDNIVSSNFQYIE